MVGEHRKLENFLYNFNFYKVVEILFMTQYLVYPGEHSLNFEKVYSALVK